jgi:aminomethyltransferase
MGVSEMTRFGMDETDFQTLAQFLHDVIVDGRSVGGAVAAFRKKFLEMKYCFDEGDTAPLVEQLVGML